MGDIEEPIVLQKVRSKPILRHTVSTHVVFAMILVRGKVYMIDPDLVSGLLGSKT